jgi:hypothetical protein
VDPVFPVVLRSRSRGIVGHGLLLQVYVPSFTGATQRSSKASPARNQTKKVFRHRLLGYPEVFPLRYVALEIVLPASEPRRFLER